MDRHVKVMGSTFALAAFSVAVVAGISAGNSGATVLFNAIIATFVCNAVGIVVGLCAQHVIAQHIESYKARNPIPSEGSTGATPSGTEQPASSTTRAQPEGKVEKK